MGLFVKKPIASVPDEKGLKRVLGPVQLTALGIGAVIGAGIFVATGEAAKNTAGPALMISYVIAGVVCLLAALCYAEFAAMTPVAGSAYAYSYATLGELMAWIIGWDLILEYAVGAATVANGWSGYVQSLLKSMNIDLPNIISSSPIKYDKVNEVYVQTHSLVNLPAVLVVMILTAILVKGIKESATANAVMVAVKLGAVLFVILVGVFYFKLENWDPFAPYGWSGLNLFGHKFGDVSSSGKPVGVLAGAAIIFFAYIGFDAVSTQAEEAKNPQRDVPIGIIGSLVICTVLYIAVVAVLTGMVKYDQISEDAGVAEAFKNVNMGWAKSVIAAAGVAGITSVLLVMMLGSARIMMAMSRDGLLPSIFSHIHPTFQTPWKGTILVGTFVALMAGLLPLDALLEMTNIGTLFAFTIVCGSVVVLRFTNPTAHRPFKVPFSPFIPVLGVLGCLMLMFSLPSHNWYRLVIWMAIGLVIYFGYSQFHSVLRKKAAAA
ncbi:MAG: amino acid permease [Gemmataceae bacterium]